jgi:ubiquinone/menaquinone biosynthesis C-methylase UbiE
MEIEKFEIKYELEDERREGEEVYSRDESLDFWERQAQAIADFECVTLPDLTLRHIERDKISTYLNPNQRVLDCGCGNGYTTLFFAQRCGEIVGTDFSPSLIEQANQRAQTQGVSNASFVCGDFLSVHLPPEHFDVCISERFLMNLESWEVQKQAISTMADLLRTNGLLLMFEGEATAKRTLSELRVSLGLAPIPLNKHNVHLVEQTLLEYMQDRFQPVETYKIGLYCLLIYVVYPLMMRPEEPRWNTRWHRVAFEVLKQTNCLPELSKSVFWAFRKIR